MTYTRSYFKKKKLLSSFFADNFQVMTCNIHKVRSVITIGGMRQGSFDKGTKASVLKARKFWRFELYCDMMKTKVTHTIVITFTTHGRTLLFISHMTSDMETVV